MKQERTSKDQDRTSTFSKTDVRYWEPRLFTRTNGLYQVQMAYAGRQERFPLHTANKAEAATKAKSIYLSLHSKGWDATLAVQTVDGREES